MSADLRVTEIDPVQDARWEAFVTGHPKALVYHHPAWVQVLQEAYGSRPLGLVCQEPNGELRGILPLFETRGILTKRRISSLPHTPVAGPLALDDPARTALIKAAIERVRAHPGMRLQLKVSSPGLDELVGELAGVPWEATYVMELPANPEDLRFGNSRNHARIKWAAKKAERLGLEVRDAVDKSDLDAWYLLYLDTMQLHAVPPRPYRFFELQWDLLRPRGLMRLLLAEKSKDGGRDLLAGSIFLMFGGTVFYAASGWRRTDINLRPNELIQLRAIGDACTAGYGRYDLGEVGDRQTSLADFKRKWGAEPERLYRYYYPSPRELETSVLKSGSRSRGFAQAVWRHLPLRATALLGGWIYRYV